MAVKKQKYCPECKSKIKENPKFCQECGYKIVITKVVEDKKGNIKKTEETIESDSPIKVPKKLTLMPDEKLLESHMDFYVSNKRLIKHVTSLLNTKTEDYHYRHIKGMQEDHYRPFLVIGLFLGVISFITGVIMISKMEIGAVMLILGLILIIISLWYKKSDIIVMHMDGSNIRVPGIKSESGKKVAKVLRAQLYNK